VTGRDFSQELTTLSQSIERLRKDIENLRGKMWRKLFGHFFHEVHQVAVLFSPDSLRADLNSGFMLNPDTDHGFAEPGSKTAVPRRLFFAAQQRIAVT
jgi:hypothetical protein